MLKRFAIVTALLSAAFPAAAQDAEAQHATTQVLIETNLGDITLALESERAPVTTWNFLRYAAEDRFDGTVFYRAMRLDWSEQPNGLIQGGTQMHPDRILDPIAHEPTSQTGLKHVAGTISMARYDPGTATGDFSILLSDQPGLDAQPNSDNPDLHAGFAAFGHVTGGMDVVRAIFEAPTDPEKGEGIMKGQMLAEPVEIIDVRLLEEETGP